MKQSITIGHDSEFALAQHGMAVSALDVFNEDVYEDIHGRYFADNMNMEIAINPVTSLKDFHGHTESLLDNVKGMTGYDLMFEPVIKYDSKYLSHPLALISGCNPDLNAYTEKVNEAPVFSEMDGTRSLGGHIHAQLDGANPYWFARWMDMLVAVPLLQHETPSSRRELYGQAGCLRVKPYGAEYRTLSNVWLDSEDKREFVYEMTHRAVELAHTKDPNDVEQWWDVMLAINNHDLDLASQVMDRLYIYGVTAL